MGGPDPTGSGPHRIPPNRAGHAPHEEPVSETPDRAASDADRIAGLPRNVFALGITSFLTDVSSEMLVPVMPLFVTATLGASMASLGLLEGFAEATASLLRLVSGRIADAPERRKPLVLAGYSLSTLCKPLMGLVATWPALLALRFGDRVGKAMRNPPRDALLADSVPDGQVGMAFGVHRAMDTFGAALGPLLAWWLLAHWESAGSEVYRRIFLVSAVPAVLAVVALWFLVRPPAPRVAAARPVADRTPLGSGFRGFVIADVLFQLGNSSMAFLLLRAGNVGFGVGEVALIYLGYNLLAALLATPFGGLSDRIGRRPLLLTGYGLYAVAYGVAAFVPSRTGALVAFALLAVHIALVDGQARSLVADLVPRPRRAGAYGVYHAAVGCALLPASVIAGLLWQHVGPAAPFAFGATCAVLAAFVFGGMRLSPAGSERHA